MNTQLKQLREERKLSCARLAEEINTTEDNIKLWEEGKLEIPNSTLKDLAMVLSCSLDEILGLRQEGYTGYCSIFAREFEQTSGRDIIAYYGGVELTFNGVEEVQDYPIDEKVAESIYKCFRHRYDDEESWGKWLIIETLNNYILFINLDYLKSAYVYSDDKEPAPTFYNPEIYRILTDWDKVHPESDIQEIAKIFDISEALSQGIKSLVQELEANDKNWNSWEKFNYLNIYWSDGSKSLHFLDNILCSDLSEFQDGIVEVKFIREEDEGGSMEFINLEKVALIEIPATKFWEIRCQEDEEGNLINYRDLSIYLPPLPRNNNQN
ncbi:MAG: XRE family transcriptional regulator [Nostocales cyanobacterium]|nr:MAG: XRE family transcriptional regulator [Nostocales cyanobacterium]TAF19767.1 MAG: XRE family transcriptional regulator [Nostocales cyanobacterium]